MVILSQSPDTFHEKREISELMVLERGSLTSFLAEEGVAHTAYAVGDGEIDNGNCRY